MNWVKRIWKLVFGIIFVAAGAYTMPSSELLGYIAVAFGLFNILWFFVTPKASAADKNAKNKTAVNKKAGNKKAKTARK